MSFLLDFVLFRECKPELPSFYGSGDKADVIIMTWRAAYNFANYRLQISPSCAGAGALCGVLESAANPNSVTQTTMPSAAVAAAAVEAAFSNSRADFERAGGAPMIK